MANKKNNKQVVNNFVVAGELLDVVNEKCFNENTPRECWGYTLRIETNPETQESHDVEFFTMVSNEKTYKSMLTIYEEAKSRARDGKGDIVRCTGRLTCGDYYSNGELVKKIVLNGSFCNRDKGKVNEAALFKPGTSFKVLGFVDKIEKVSDEEMVIDALVNEYKSSKSGKIKGHILSFIAKGVNAVTALSETVNEEDIIPFGGVITEEIKTIFLPEEETAPLDTSGAWGTMLDDLEEKNREREILRKEGIKNKIVQLVLTGSDKAITTELIEEEKIPFESSDIDDMLDEFESRMEDSKNKDAQRNVNNSDIPF